jgi:hypothetical protein
MVLNVWYMRQYVTPVQILVFVPCQVEILVLAQSVLTHTPRITPHNSKGPTPYVNPLDTGIVRTNQEHANYLALVTYGQQAYGYPLSGVARMSLSGCKHGARCYSY